MIDTFVMARPKEQAIYPFLFDGRFECESIYKSIPDETIWKPQKLHQLTVGAIIVSTAAQTIYKHLTSIAIRCVYIVHSNQCQNDEFNQQTVHHFSIIFFFVSPFHASRQLNAIRFRNKFFFVYNKMWIVSSDCTTHTKRIDTTYWQKRQASVSAAVTCAQLNENWNFHSAKSETRFGFWCVRQ